MPGTPLIETPAGRGALSLVRLALEDYARVAVFDFLGLAPLTPFVPTLPATRLRQRTGNASPWKQASQRHRALARSLECFSPTSRSGCRTESDEPEWRRQRAQRNSERRRAPRRHRSAARALDPADASRSPPPPSFRPSGTDRDLVRPPMRPASRRPERGRPARHDRRCPGPLRPRFVR